MAFGFQYNFFPVVNVLNYPTNKRLMKASFLGLTFPLVFYFLVSFLGYSVYKTNTKANFLLSFTADDIGQFLYTLVYLSFIGAEIMTFPIYFFEARNLFLFFIDVIIGKRELFDESPFKENMDSTKKEMIVEPFRID